jgi:hypothetical protein
MLLIQLLLRWLMLASPGVEAQPVRATPAPIAMKNMASRHPIGLAPIHAPPPRLALS